MSVRVAPQDARRGGLVILGADSHAIQQAARVYAASGYEAIVAQVGEAFERLIAPLAPPVFILAFADAAVGAWNTTGIAAVSIVGDARMASVVTRPPTASAMLHLDPPSHARLAAAFEAAQPDLPVHLLPETEDGERLLHLRTLRLFSTHAGGRGEV